MFWGLIMEPQRRYTQKVKKSFHVSMAALDIASSSEEPAQIMLGFEGRNYLLCTLKKPDMVQCALDLNFEVGSELSFVSNGKCHVHLTGYLIDDPLSDDLDGLEEEEDVEGEEEESDDEKVEDNKAKRSKKEQKNGPPAKKSKLAKAENVADDSDSDSDLDVKDLLEKTLDSDDDDATYKSDDEEGEEEENGEEEDSEEEEEGDDEGEDDESSMSDEADSEDEVVEVSSPRKKNKQLNGVAKPEQAAKSNKEKHQQQKQEQKEKPNKKEGTPALKKKELNGGVVIEEIKEGEGAPAKSGKFVSVYYEGRLKQNNKLFDSAKKGAGFSFRLGAGEVIKGWDVGVVGMKPGGRRKIICPPAMAYGQKGSPPAIPANSTLVFEVELKKVR